MQVPTVPPLEGVDDLYSLLAFLVDPEAVEKRLAQMESVRDEINKLVEKVGKAGDIDRLYIQAKTARETAERELEQAREKARQAMAEVDKADAARRADYAVQHAKMEADLASKRDELNAQAKTNAVDWHKIEQAESATRAADKARTAADARHAELTKLKEQYESKLAAIKKAAEGS